MFASTYSIDTDTAPAKADIDNQNQLNGNGPYHSKGFILYPKILVHSSLHHRITSF
jgi:hypothetical protein